ncbi:MAG: hypothetical protein WC234_06795, partial [Endomicrobiaceae bacterium]
ETEGSEIEIRESEIEGRGRIKGTGTIEIIDSEAGEIKAEGSGRGIIEGSRIKADKIEIGESAEIKINGCKVETEKGIIINDSAALDIKNTTIESAAFGIKKTGTEALICKKTSINSSGICIDVLNADIFAADNVSLKSKTNYSLLIKKSKDIFLTDFKISGNKGFFFTNTSNVYINKLKMDTISNLFKITDSNISVNNFGISSKIFQQSIFVEGKSQFNLTGGAICVLDDFKYVSEYPVAAFRNGSCVSFKDVNIETVSSSDIKLILCKEEVNFTAKNINAKKFNHFLDVYDDSFVFVSDSHIETKSDSITLHDNSKVDVAKTIFINTDSFKFSVHDFALLKVEKISVKDGLFASCDKYAQIYSESSKYKLGGNAVRMTGSSAIYDLNSKWEVSSQSQNKYLFSLIDNAKLNVDKSEFYMNQQYLFSFGKTEVNILNSKITDYNKHFLFDCRFNSKLNVFNTNITALFIFQLQDNSKAFISKSDLNVKNTAVKMSDSSIVSVSDSNIKSIGRDSKGFIALNYSKINILNSIVDKFYSGIICSNSENVNIENTKINCRTQFLRSNEINIKNRTVHYGFIRSVQLFVLNTRNFYILKLVYKFIYLFAVKVYPFVCSGNKNIKSVYLRRGMLNNDWIPGSSDIDYLTVIKNSKLYAEIQHVFDIHVRYKKIKKIFPFYGENLIMSESELDFYLKYGGIRANNLSDAKLLDGRSNGSFKRESYKHNEKKLKTDIISEVMNSYILFSNNYFCDNNIVTDICFSKAAADILKYSEFFRNSAKPVNSRTDFLEYYLDNYKNEENGVLINLLYVLKDNALLEKNDRNRIFDLIFGKLNDLSLEFNNFAGHFMNIKKIKKDKQLETGNILFDEKIPALQREMPFSSIILDSPGMCYVETDYIPADRRYSESFVNFNREIKKIKIVYNTPVMFFTKNMFRSLLLSVFRGTPLNYLNLTNINNRYLHRLFYLKENAEYYSHNSDTLKIFVFEAVSDISFHINNIDISKKFIDNKEDLFSLLMLFFGFNLYIKNARINKNSFYNGIIDAYKNYNK